MINNINGGRYYQWVGFVLLLQGILFLGPYMLWKFLEGGRVNQNHMVIWAVIEKIILETKNWLISSSSSGCKSDS